MNKSDIPNKCLLTENTGTSAHAPLPSDEVLSSGLRFPSCAGSCIGSCGVGPATSLAVAFSFRDPRAGPAHPSQRSRPSLVLGVTGREVL